MADTVPISAGTGTIISTDEVTIGGVVQHVQRMKLMSGADGSIEFLGGDAANGLDVDVTRIPMEPGGTPTAGTLAATTTAAASLGSK